MGAGANVRCCCDGCEGDLSTHDLAGFARGGEHAGQARLPDEAGCALGRRSTPNVYSRVRCHACPVQLGLG
jgi:hypothetical protein